MALDKRIGRTRKNLMIALAQLLGEKDIREITVQELADLANINRVTFYGHYKDVYDMYNIFEETLISEIHTMLTSRTLMDYKDLYRVIMEYVLKQPRYGQLLFGLFDQQHFRNRVTVLICDHYLLLRYPENTPTLQELSPMEQYLIHYHVHGSIAMIRKWIADDFVCPKEEVLDMLAQAWGDYI